MSAHFVLAIDPGATGAAVLLDSRGETVMGAWAWKDFTKDKRTRYSFFTANGIHIRDFRSLNLVGAAVAFDARRALEANRREFVYLVVEGLFVKSARGALKLSWDAAMVAGPCEALASNKGDEILRPMAMTWRRAALGIPGNTKGPAAEAYAIKMAKAAGYDLGKLQDNGHAAEAVWQAKHGATHQRELERAEAYR